MLKTKLLTPEISAVLASFSHFSCDSGDGTTECLRLGESIAKCFARIPKTTDVRDRSDAPQCRIKQIPTARKFCFG
jgi:hypothetical protein